MPQKPGDAKLAAAYAATEFVVEVQGRTLVLRIDHPAPPELDLELRSHGMQTSAFLTAWNPGSVVLSKTENDARQVELRDALRRDGWTFLEGKGIDPSGAWEPEESVLILGIDKAGSTELAESFGQNAYVWIEIGRPVQLVFTAHWRAGE